MCGSLAEFVVCPIVFLDIVIIALLPFQVLQPFRPGVAPALLPPDGGRQRVRERAGRLVRRPLRVRRLPGEHLPRAHREAIREAQAGGAKGKMHEQSFID